MVNARILAAYCDDLLNVREIDDKSLNGLQVASLGEIKKAAFAVDASLECVDMAARNGASILFVHHGLFWGETKLITGSLYWRIKSCISNNIALYAVHLPLDRHPVLGNNVQLINKLGFKPSSEFGSYHSVPLGRRVLLQKPILLKDFVARVNKTLMTRSVVLAHGPQRISRIGVVSGDGSYSLEEAKDNGLDTLLTGESSHIAVPLAKELEMNVIFAGHYATETLGLKALASHLEKKFKISTLFVDIPTGL